MLGTCNTCVRLYSPESQVLVPQIRVGCVCFFIYIFFILLLLFFYFILLNFYLFIYLFNYVFILHFLSFACFCFVAVDFFIFYWPICVCVCVCVCVLLSLSSFPPSLFILCAGFISLLVGLGLIFRWSETKISYFGVIYNFLMVGYGIGCN